MTYDWFRIFNRLEFQDEELFSRDLTLNLVGVGQVDLMITRGVGYGIMIDDTFLHLGINGRNPFYMNSYGIYQDEDSNVYLGVGSED